MAKEESRFTDGVKKVLLAGLGAVSLGAEKSKEVLDVLAERGEVTAEQARALRKDLEDQGKTFSQNFADKVTSVSARTRDKAAEALKGRKIVLKDKEIDLSEVISSLSLEQLEALKKGLWEGKEEEASEEGGIPDEAFEEEAAEEEETGEISEEAAEEVTAEEAEVPEDAFEEEPAEEAAEEVADEPDEKPEEEADPEE